MTLEQTGSYSFNYSADIRLFANIYDNDFDPLNSRKNRIATSSYINCSYFGFAAYLQVNTTYILMITTFYSNVQGSFKVIATGPNNITFNRIGE